MRAIKLLSGALVLYIVTSILLTCVRHAFGMAFPTFPQTVSWWIAVVILTLIAFLILQTDKG